MGVLTASVFVESPPGTMRAAARTLNKPTMTARNRIFEISVVQEVEEKWNIGDAAG